MANREELFRFLDQKIFEPILKAKPENYHGQDRERLADVQRRTRTERDRYEHYPSAEKLKQMYMDDLSSEHAEKVNSELQRLHLPILADVKDEFLKMAG